MNPSVLVTGASSGIGLATVRLLAESGHRVFAGVRRLSASPPKGVEEIVLDVADGESIARARGEIAARLGDAGLDGLVNNAGIADIAPIEFNAVENFRRVFEVNVFGMVAVTQAFLPLLHRARGRIVNIGSVGGMITIPFGATLCASKHAVEALSDCMRLELFAAGIHVTCLQPASINSGSAEKLAGKTDATIAALPPEGQRRYGALLRRFMDVTVRSETKGSPPTVVAEAVRDVLAARNPPSRRVVGKEGFLLRLVARAIPDDYRDRLLRRVFLTSTPFGSAPADRD
jgi:NAD(P)-dependent dehydrogenase (short-subunit alcohol dehydrogenase family)